MRPASRVGPAGRSPFRLVAIAGPEPSFEIVHPRCVEEARLDYAEGLELWKAGDPEEARDALRFALQACGDNMWVHVALGWIALREFNDPNLARGHFGYAVDLGRKAIPPDFSGRLPRDREANQPYFEALDGLARSLRALGRSREADELTSLAARLDRASAPRPNRPAGPSKGSSGGQASPRC